MSVLISLAVQDHAHRIHLFCFPSHTTAVLQPLDVGVYGPLKKQWKKILKKYKLQTRARNDNRTVFPSLIGQVWSTSFTKQQLQSGFRATELCPLNRQAIPDAHLAVSAPYSQEINPKSLHLFSHQRRLQNVLLHLLQLHNFIFT